MNIFWAIFRCLYTHMCKNIHINLHVHINKYIYLYSHNGKYQEQYHLYRDLLIGWLPYVCACLPCACDTPTCLPPATCETSPWWICHPGDSSVGRASDCRYLQQSDGPWLIPGRQTQCSWSAYVYIYIYIYRCIYIYIYIYKCKCIF